MPRLGGLAGRVKYTCGFTEVLPQYRVITRSLLRLNIRSIETIQWMFKCWPH
ncbi:hypothetical protein HanXRQr2_Chr15g0690851 [Helianthus annuus]|uniref:Uncharacterized protein n=1 Tax=Helianthus annuus TaxID=4232 RepID=A0A9K3H4B9_HELAN|nr:hypothetical protein HanXRQr2_Chr15g0690851 [Helianthus annuus]KAJ0831063.1 hypothetical protein HanPSC8_Chr15g0662691 [Helianthus annuus]